MDGISGYYKKTTKMKSSRPREMVICILELKCHPEAKYCTKCYQGTVHFFLSKMKGLREWIYARVP